MSRLTSCMDPALGAVPVLLKGRGGCVRLNFVCPGSVRIGVDILSSPSKVLRLSLASEDRW